MLTQFACCKISIYKMDILLWHNSTLLLPTSDSSILIFLGLLLVGKARVSTTNCYFPPRELITHLWLLQLMKPLLLSQFLLTIFKLIHTQLKVPAYEHITKGFVISFFKRYEIDPLFMFHRQQLSYVSS